MENMAEPTISIQWRTLNALSGKSSLVMKPEGSCRVTKGGHTPTLQPWSKQLLAGSVLGLERLDKPAFGNACECQAERLCRSGTVRTDSICSAPPMRGSFDTYYQSWGFLAEVFLPVKCLVTKLLFSFSLPVPS